MGKGAKGTGTRFEYWVPKVGDQLLPPKADGEPPPKKLLQQYFHTVSLIPFGAKGALEEDVAIPRWEILAAALNAGYGSREALAAGAIPKLTKPSDLRHYLLQRLEMAFSCIGPAGTKLTAREFFEVVESSEKNAVSFITGCIGTYIAARRWLKASGTTLSAFLHVGLYTKASAVGPKHYVNMTKLGARVPDFVVQGSDGNWHVFESKGGGTSSRWKQIVSGLRQLACVGTVHQHPQAAAAPTSLAVVQTRVDSGVDLEVTLVDPPRDGKDEEDGEESEDEKPGLQIDIQLVPGAWQLMRFMDTVDWFEILRDAAPPENFLTADLWTFAKTPRLGGAVVGIPSAWLKRAPEIVDRMTTYFAIAAGDGPQDLPAHARQLGLEPISRELERDLSAAMPQILQLVLTQEGDRGVTETGMFIQAAVNAESRERGDLNA